MTRHWTRRFLSVAMLLLLCTSPVPAQEVQQPAPTNTQSQPSSAGTTTLPEMVVSEKAEKPDTGYVATRATSATKTDTPIMQTPASIQVIPRQVIEDQQALRLYDVTRNVSGVLRQYDTGGSADDLIIRGFGARRSMYRDGVLAQDSTFDLANIERVEVLKGPSAMLYGRLEPGGLVNQVSKRPLNTPYFSLQQQFGSFDLYRTTLDSTGPVLGNTAVLYRFNLAYQDSQSFRNFVSLNRIFLAPSLTWHITDRTQLDIDFLYQDDDPQLLDNGIPAFGRRPAPIPISRNLTEPTDRSAQTAYQETVSLTHRINDAWTVRSRFVKYDTSGSVVNTQSNPFGSALDETTGTMPRGIFVQRPTQDTLYGTLDITGRFVTWRLKHALLAGVDRYERHDGQHGFSKFFTDGVAPINIFAPRYGLTTVNVADPSGAFGKFRTHEHWWAGYLQDQIQFAERWHLLLGGRFDHAVKRTTFIDTTGAASPSRNSVDEFSQRYGLLYQPWDWLSAYFSYVQAFNAANSGRLLDGTSNLKPERSRQYEVGLKGQWWNGRLLATLALYELTKTNVVVPHPDPELAAQGVVTLTGKARSRGIEFDLYGHLREDWDLIATYAFTDAETLKGQDPFSGTPLPKGRRLVNVPRHAGSVWSSLGFSQWGVPGLRWGVGIYVQEQRPGDIRDTFALPGYVRVDTALSYSWRLGPTHMTAQLNVNNLLDKTYYETSGGDSFLGGGRDTILPGARRTFLGSIRVEF